MSKVHVCASCGGAFSPNTWTERTCPNLKCTSKIFHSIHSQFLPIVLLMDTWENGCPVKIVGTKLPHARPFSCFSYNTGHFPSVTLEFESAESMVSGLTFLRDVGFGIKVPKTPMKKIRKVQDVATTTAMCWFFSETRDFDDACMNLLKNADTVVDGFSADSGYTNYTAQIRPKLEVQSIQEILFDKDEPTIYIKSSSPDEFLRVIRNGGRPHPRFVPSDTRTKFFVYVPGENYTVRAVYRVHQDETSGDYELIRELRDAHVDKMRIWDRYAQAAMAEIEYSFMSALTKVFANTIQKRPADEQWHASRLSDAVGSSFHIHSAIAKYLNPED